MRDFVCLLSKILLLFAASLGVSETIADDLQLTLPTEFYAIPGSEMSVYFAETILAEHPEEFQFEVNCDVGSQETRRWHVVPEANDVGRHELTLSVADAEGNKLATATTALVVAPLEAGKNRKLRLLIVGDSLTNASQYPNEIARLLGRPDNPTFTMLGTHKPSGVAPGVAHEGYGGWTWQRFLEHYEPEPDGTHRKMSSPFVFLGEDGTPGLDVPRYFAEHCDGVAPDVIVIKLGINDCYRANTESPATLDASIDKVFQYADKLLTAFREAAPKAELGICLTTPGNGRDAAFGADESGKEKRWTWRRIQHRLVQRQLEHFGGQQEKGLFIIPTELNLDTIDGYPADNAVHPNDEGYVEIGTTIYAWLKHRLAESD